MKSTTRILAGTLALAAFSFYSISAQTVHEFSGTITENTSWTDDTIKITGEVTIEDDITLTIAPGTVVKLMEYCKLNVLGTLIAIGAENDSILFTVADTSGYHTDSTESGGWAGIIFNNTYGYAGGDGTMADNDSSILSHCIIEFVKGTSPHYDRTLMTGGIYVRSFSNLVIEYSQIRYCKSIFRGGAICMEEHSNPVIRHNLFRYNEAHRGGAIYAYESNPFIHNNIITRNSNGDYEDGNGGGLYISTSSAVIQGNEISYNSTLNNAGGLGTYECQCLIENNDIFNNVSENAGGVFLTGHDRSWLINNNVFNNYAIRNAGIYVNSGKPRIISNSIFNNEAAEEGGGISLLQCSPLILNNTIVNNLADLGGGLYVYSSDPEIINSILWGNEAVSSGPQIYFYDNILNPTIKYSTIGDGQSGFGYRAGVSFGGTYENNLEIYPEFLQATPGTGPLPQPVIFDWRLAVSSSCVNKGTHQYVDDFFPETDNNEEIRVLYGRIDMGALETRIDSISISGTIASDSLLIADTIRVTGDLMVEDDVTLSIGAGCVVLFEGRYEFEIGGTLLACGTEQYPITFTSGDTLNFSNPNIQEGGWQGIWFDNGQQGGRGSMHDNDTSRICHCIIEFVKTRPLKWSGPVFQHYFDRLKIHNNRIRNNLVFRGSSGIYATNSEVDIRDNIIEGNKTIHLQSSFGGAGMYLHDVQGIVKGNTVVNNFINSYNGGIAAYYTKLRIEGNTISYNKAGGDRGGIMLAYGEDTLINNIITNNSDEGVHLLNSKSILIGNLICNNRYGIVSRDADILLTNNTIVNNLRDGIYAPDSKCRIYNTIFHGNNWQVDMTPQHEAPVIHNCLIEGGLDGIRDDIPGDYANIIDGDPGFIMPTEGNDPDYDGLTADFSLYQVSSCIDRGVHQLDNLLPALDIGDQPRIHNDIIDIGAFENQDGNPVIEKHPFGGKFCDGDTLVLIASARDTASYQWMREEQVLPGRKSMILRIDSLSLSQEGNYYCRISNAYDTLETIPAYITVNSAPRIVLQPEDTWVEQGLSEKISVYATGGELTYQWFREGTMLNGEILPEYRYSISDSAEEGKYHCVVDNYCGSDISDEGSIYLAPQICMVTVSPTTGHNLVVWEKKSKAPVMTYNIYRESVAAGIYDLLATISSDDLSVYVDTSADPTVQAYLYKITAVDTSDYETDIDLCNPHKTIHLLVTTNPELNTTQLAWDRYYGFEYHTYTIYRSSTGVNFDPVHSMSASLNSWTDPDASTGDLFYRIAVEKPDPCVPDGGSKKAGTGPYVNSLSNMDDNKLKAGENPPDSIMLDNHTIDENLLPGSLVGRLSTRDADTLDSYTYQLVEGEGDEDNSSFTLIGDLLIAAVTFDFETKSSYTLRIRTTDNAAFYLEKAFSVTINDTGEGTTTGGETPPDSVYLDNLSIAENNNFGDPIGMLITADKDANDVHGYMLVSGTGDDDNIMFMITGNVLRAGFTFDYEADSLYSIRVRSTDLSGNQVERIFIIMISDVKETVGIIGYRINGIRVYPNPFAESATIFFPNPEEEAYSLIISDLSGKVLRRRDHIAASKFILQKAELQKGMYFLRLEGSKTYRTRIVID